MTDDDDDAPTPETVTLPPGRPRPSLRRRHTPPSSNLKVTIRETVINDRPCTIVRVEDNHGVEPEGVFETAFYTKRELRAYLCGLDHAVFPDALVLPDKWRNLIR